MKRTNLAAKTAVGGMAVALSVVLMLPTALDLLEYALPAMAGILTLFCVIELGRLWALGVYVATAVIGALVLPNKKAIVMYIAFFGFYAILKSLLESRLPRAAEYLLKFLLFNVCMAGAIWFTMQVFGLTLNEIIDVNEDAWWAQYAVPGFILLGNVAFVGYDICLTLYATAYTRTLQKQFRRLFRFR